MPNNWDRLMASMKLLEKEAELTGDKQTEFWDFLNTNVFTTDFPIEDPNLGEESRKKAKSYLLDVMHEHLYLPLDVKLNTARIDWFNSDIDFLLNRCVTTKKLHSLMKKLLNEACLIDPKVLENYLTTFVFPNFHENYELRASFFQYGNGAGFRYQSYNTLLSKIINILFDSGYEISADKEDINCSSLSDFVNDLETKIFDKDVFPIKRTERSIEKVRDNYETNKAAWQSTIIESRKKVLCNLDKVITELLKAALKRDSLVSRDHVSFEFELTNKPKTLEIGISDGKSATVQLDAMKTRECAHLFDQILLELGIGSIEIPKLDVISDYWPNPTVTINTDLENLYDCWLKITKATARVKKDMTANLKTYLHKRWLNEGTETYCNWIANLIALEIIRQYCDFQNNSTLFGQNPNNTDEKKEPLLNKENEMLILRPITYLIDLATKELCSIGFSTDEIPPKEYIQNTIKMKVWSLIDAEILKSRLSYDFKTQGDYTYIYPNGFVSAYSLSLYQQAIEEENELISLRNKIGPNRCLTIISSVIAASIFNGGMNHTNIDISSLIGEAERNNNLDKCVEIKLLVNTPLEYRYIELLISRLYSFDCSLKGNETNGMWALSITLNLKYFLLSLKAEYEALVSLREAWEKREREVERQLIINPLTNRNQKPGKLEKKS